MENKENFCICNLCESCLHVHSEKQSAQNCDLDCFALSECNHKKQKYCKLCKQPLFSINDYDFSKDLTLLESALNNKNLKVVCFTAPSVRVSLGDNFGLEIGENVEGKMVSALKSLGFYQVFDMNTAADFTILEEAQEFVHRFNQKKNLPMFTSCCPGWVNFIKKVHPNYIKNLSTCKSPQQMFGSLINTYYAEKHNLESTDLFVVSIVPCLAKKLEIKQTKNVSIGFDVDLAITTNEIAQLIKAKNIDFLSLQEQSFDNFFGGSSGAGAIFGNTGGVTEAILRTVEDSLSPSEQTQLEYNLVRGLDGIKRATVKFDNQQINIAVVMGLKNVSSIMQELKENPNKYDFIEVMACEGGCIGGGGQPQIENIPHQQVLLQRAKGLYNCELKREQRKAHKNPAVQEVYKNYLGKIGGTKAKKLLHRDYK